MPRAGSDIVSAADPEETSAGYGDEDALFSAAISEVFSSDVLYSVTSPFRILGMKSGA